MDVRRLPYATFSMFWPVWLSSKLLMMMGWMFMIGYKVTGYICMDVCMYV